jgi:thiamine biosynthesis lipoprotein
MKQTRLMMGMPITLEVVDASVTAEAFEQVFAYFGYVDAKFSTYKDTSEIMQINQGELTLHEASADMQQIFALAEQTKQATDGYFDIQHNGHIDPSGIVKGWAIYNAAQLLEQNGYENFYVDAGGDAQIVGKNMHGDNWRVGIRNPFNTREIVKTVSLSNSGIATSGAYIRGDHIYNPLQSNDPLDEIVSMTVIGPNVYEADRFATAAYAMGRQGILFIEALDGFEGYMIDRDGLATLTSGFAGYVHVDTQERVSGEF